MSQHPAVKNGAYDVYRVREDFPALAMQVYGKPLVYLDNAASAQKPTAVLDRMTEAYKSEYANVHRGLHYLANAATEAYEGGRAKVAKFLNAARTEEIIFTRNATEAINLVASSWGEPNIKAGDDVEVYLERMENRDGEAVLSREKAKREESWAVLEKSFQANQRVTGVIFGRVKGGFTVDLNGATAFLPGSQVDIRPVRDIAPLMGTPQPFQILKMDRARGNSRKYDEL